MGWVDTLAHSRPLDSMNGTVSVQAQGTGMSRASCTILVGLLTIFYQGKGKVVCSLVSLPECQLSLMLEVGSLCLLGMLDVFTRDWTLTLGLLAGGLFFNLARHVSCNLSSLKLLIFLSLPPCTNIKIDVMLLPGLVIYELLNDDKFLMLYFYLYSIS